MRLGIGRMRLVKVVGAAGATVAMVLMSMVEPALAATPNTAGPPTTTHAMVPANE
jgi:hypothetical protein